MASTVGNTPHTPTRIWTCCAPPHAAAALAVFFAAFLASFAAGLPRGRDPLDVLPLLPALALFAWGASREGEATSSRALALLAACGAVTGALASLQRFAGVLRLPVEAPEPRFFATALIGNPGDVGASLVLPALVETGDTVVLGRASAEPEDPFQVLERVIFRRCSSHSC